MLVQRDIGPNAHRHALVDDIIWPIGRADKRLVDRHTTVIADACEELRDRFDRFLVDLSAELKPLFGCLHDVDLLLPAPRRPSWRVFQDDALGSKLPTKLVGKRPLLSTAQSSTRLYQQ